MLQKRNNNRGGFTLVEVMVVIAIIALLAAIAVPNLLRARKRSQATSVLEDLRLVDSSISQYAIESNKVSGAPADWTDIKAFLKTDSTLYKSGGKDLLNNDINGGSFQVDSVPKIAAATFTALSDIAPAEFWSPYY